MPYLNREVQREYQRQWRQRRRDEYLSGRSCVWCGATGGLQVDHIDRSQKVSHRIWSWAQHRRDAELEKCQILCGPCHLTKTGRERLPPHGNESRYKNHKCRCVDCVNVAAEARQRRRYARIAQPVERRVANAEVAGS